MSEARVVDIFESIKPASIIGIKAAAARSRFISGVGVGTGVIFVINVSYQWQQRSRRKVTQTMLASAKSMAWKDLHPVVELSHTDYEKGISLSKQARNAGCRVQAGTKSAPTHRLRGMNVLGDHLKYFLSKIATPNKRLYINTV